MSLISLITFSGLKAQEINDATSNEKSKNNLQYPSEISSTIIKYCNTFPNDTELAIATISNGVINYYGVKVADQQLIPANNEHLVFEIGSITKVFTTTVLAQLVVDQKLQLAQPINTYFPYAFNKQTEINFLTLANHTSGLPRLPNNIKLLDPKNPYINYSKEDLDRFLLKYLDIKKESPLKYTYSNLGTAILGYAVSLSQKETLQKLIQKNIFDKYKMHNAYHHYEGIPNLVKGLDPKGNTTPYWKMNVFYPAGGIVTSVADLSKFMLAQLDSSNEVSKLTQQITFDQNQKVGLGWHIIKTLNGDDAYWHNGGTGGFTSSLVFKPTTQTGVVILSNVSAYHSNMGNIDKLCFELMKHIQPK